MSLKTVNPGNLITSLEWNELVATINSIDLRVGNLEKGGTGQAPIITQVLPTGPITAGDTIRIYGSNFNFSQGGHSVFFGNTRAISFLGGSSDTLLIVIVPDPVEGATETGTPMTLTVGNLVDTAKQAITVKSKPAVVSGGIQFTFKGTRPTSTPTQNAQFFYDFELKSQASEGLTVTVSPSIAVILPLPPGVFDPNLPSLLVLLDSDGTERPNDQVSLPEGSTKTVSLRLNLPNNTNNLQYSLSATASSPGVTAKIETLPTQQVGVAVEQPDPTITSFEFSSIVDGDAAFSTDTGGMSGVDGTLSVKANSKASIEVDAAFAGIPAGQTNQYQITAEVGAPALGWSTAVNPIMQNPLPEPAPGGPVSIFFDITAPGAAATATLKLTLTRQGIATNNKRSVSYRLMLKP
jgi:hypothetical protein